MFYERDAFGLPFLLLVSLSLSPRGVCPAVDFVRGEGLSRLAGNFCSDRSQLAARIVGIATRPILRRPVIPADVCQLCELYVQTGRAPVGGDFRIYDLRQRGIIINAILSSRERNDVFA